MGDPSLLPQSLRALVEAELEPGEGLRWVEQPLSARAARMALPAVLFAIPWTGFALFWIWAAARGSAHTSGPFQLFPLFGVPFVGVGLGMFSSPFWAARAARRTVYVVTDRRALVIREGGRGGESVRSFAPEKLADLRREQLPDGSGNLVFGEDLDLGPRGRRIATSYGFMAVPDVRAAEEYVRALARQAPRS
jgi:hypothetical protein